MQFGSTKEDVDVKYIMASNITSTAGTNLRTVENSGALSIGVRFGVVASYLAFNL
jgi:hypothetical protein